MRNLTIDGRDVTDELLAFTQALVRIQSYSGEEGPLAHYILGEMQRLGFDEACIDRSGNVWGRVGKGGRSILFDLHLDTVAVTDAAEWARAPFSGEIADGYLWGRGAVDMKSGMAASIYAAAIAKSQGLLDGKTVYVSCTVDEEFCDGEGLRHLLDDLSLRPDYAVICEPSNNVIATGHKGKAQVTIRTHGVSAHGAAPEKGVNAIYEMAEIIQRVEQANQELMQKPGRKGTLVLSQISSTGVSLNAVPSECEIYLDRRMVPGETQADIRLEMERLIAGKNAKWQIEALHRQTWTGETLTYQPLHEAWQIELEHPLAQAFIAASTETFGKAPEKFDYWDFSTNAVAVVRLGVPTIGFGPGEYKLAHMRDERCAVSEIVAACEVYVRVMGRV